MKYIITQGYDVYIFGIGDDHKATAKKLGLIDNILSAGFITMSDEDNEMHCYGESLSLKVKSRKDLDTEIVYRQMKSFL